MFFQLARFKLFGHKLAHLATLVSSSIFGLLALLAERTNRKSPMYCTLILSGGAGLDRHLRPEGEQYKDKFAKKNHVMLKIVQKAITRGTYSQLFKLPG